MPLRLALQVPGSGDQDRVATHQAGRKGSLGEASLWPPTEARMFVCVHLSELAPLLHRESLMHHSLGLIESS